MGWRWLLLQAERPIVFLFPENSGVVRHEGYTYDSPNIALKELSFLQSRANARGDRQMS